MPEQLQFPFPSLDFPGRTVLYPHEIAGPNGRIGMSLDQLYDLVDEGVIVAINLASVGASRRELRIPIEAWRNFILSRMSGPLRRDFMLALPRATLRELVHELQEYLRTSTAA